LNLKWDMWQKQIEALKALRSQQHDIVVFQGGYRSGKTITGARHLISHALENPGVVNVGVGVSYSEAKRTTFPVLFEELPGENTDPFLKGGDPENSPIVSEFSKQDKVLNIKLQGREPSAIVLGSSDKPSRFEGGNFDQVWLDEAGLYRNRLFGIMDTFAERSRQQFWTTTGKAGALRTILEDQLDKDGDPIGLNIKQVRASTLDNPFLDEEDKQRLRRQYEGRVNEDMALQGGFGSVEGRVYAKFNRVDHVVRREDVDLDAGWGRVYGYDAGWDDPRVLVEVAKTHTGQLVVTDLFYRSGAYTSELIQWMQDNDKERGMIYSEHEPQDIQKFKTDLGFPAQKAEKDLDAGIPAVRQRLEKDKDGRPGLLVCEDVGEELIAEFNNYVESDVGGTDVDDHALDALRYAIMGLETKKEVRLV